MAVDTVPSGQTIVNFRGSSKTSGTTLALTGTTVTLAVGDVVIVGFQRGSNVTTTSTFAKTGGTCVLGASTRRLGQVQSGNTGYEEILTATCTTAGTLTGITVTHLSVTPRLGQAIVLRGLASEVPDGSISGLNSVSGTDIAVASVSNGGVVAGTTCVGFGGQTGPITDSGAGDTHLNMDAPTNTGNLLIDGTTGSGATSNQMGTMAFTLSLSATSAGSGTNQSKVMASGRGLGAYVSLWWNGVSGTAWDPGTQADAAGITDSVTTVHGWGVVQNDPVAGTDALASLSAYIRAVADPVAGTDAVTTAAAMLRTIAGRASVVGHNVGGTKLADDLIGWDAGQSFTIDFDYFVAPGAAATSAVPLFSVSTVAALDQAGTTAFAPVAMVDTLGRLRVTAFWIGSNSPVVLTGADDGIQHHLTLTYDGTNQRTYIDGSLVHTLAATPATFATHYSYFLGASPASSFWTSMGTADANGWVLMPSGSGVDNLVLRTGVQSPLTGEQLAITDALAAGLAFSVSPADAAGITDAVVTAQAFVSAISDAAGITDAPSPFVVYARAIADPIAITDAVAAGLSYAVLPADNAGITDAVATVAAYVRQVADPLAGTDAAAPVSAFNPIIADSAGITDAAAVLATYLRSVADPAGITDAAAVVQGFNVAPADSAGITDALASITAYVRTVADPIAATDAVALAFTTLLADGATITDALASVAAYVRQVDDPASITDSVAAQGTGALSTSLSDAIAATDATSTQAAYSRSIADTAGLTDALALALAQLLADAATITDTLTPAAVYVRGLADVGALTDALAATSGTLRAIADPAGITDSTARLSGYSQQVADAAALTDALLHDSNYDLHLADALAIADALDVAQQFVIALNDTGELTDFSVPILFAGGVTRWLSVLLSDSALMVLALTAEPLASVLLTDDALASVEVHAEPVDTVLVEDEDLTTVNVEAVTE